MSDDQAQPMPPTLPTLLDPSGAPLLAEPLTSDAEPGVQGFSTLAAADLGLAALHGHFESQLEVAGWSRTRLRDGIVLAWSDWTLPEANWRGALLVLAEHDSPGLRVSLRAWRKDAEQSSQPVPPQPPSLLFEAWAPTETVRERLTVVLEWVQRIVERGEAAGHEFGIGSGSGGTSGRFSAAAWERLSGRLLVGRLDGLYCGSHDRDGNSILIRLRGLTDPDYRAIATLEVTATLGGQPMIGERDLVARAFEVVQAVGATYARVMPAWSQRPFYPPFHTRALEPVWVDWGRNGLKRYVRGPGWRLGWAFWLTEGHLAALGGRERVVHAAPVHRVIERDAGLWLELAPLPWTPYPFQVSDDALKRLEAYLRPVLPTRELVLQADPPAPMPIFEPLTQADRYVRYKGPPVPHEWLHTEGVDVDVHVYLQREPSDEQRRALDRAMRAWYEAGVDGKFNAPGDDGAAGLHGLSGPRWGDLVGRWHVDTGSADAVIAYAGLARRLGTWSRKWGYPITLVRLGYEEP